MATDCFIVGGSKFSSVVKPLLNILGHDGYLYIKGEAAKHSVRITGIGKQGGTFFESKEVLLDGPEEDLVTDFECCLGSESFQHFSKLFVDDKVVSYHVFLGEAALIVISTSVFKRKTKETSVDRNISIPLLEKIPTAEIKNINKAVDSFSSEAISASEGLQFKEAFSVAVSAACPPGSRLESYEAVFLQVEEDGNITVIGTDGVKASLFYGKLVKIPDKSLVGSYAISYNMSNFLSKHFDPEVPVYINVINSSLIMFKSGNTCIGGALLDIESPSLGKMLDTEGMVSFVLDKNLVNTMINSMYSIIELDSTHKSVVLEIGDGILKLYPTKKATDFITGISVEYPKEIKARLNSEKFLTCLRSFKNSTDIKVFFTENDPDSVFIMLADDDPEVKSVLKPLNLS